MQSDSGDIIFGFNCLRKIKNKSPTLVGQGDVSTVTADNSPPATEQTCMDTSEVRSRWHALSFATFVFEGKDKKIGKFGFKGSALLSPSSRLGLSFTIVWRSFNFSYHICNKYKFSLNHLFCCIIGFLKIPILIQSQ